MMKMARSLFFKLKFAETSCQFRYVESIERAHSKVSITILFIIFYASSEIFPEAIEQKLTNTQEFF